jgi:hypothetical protein
MIWTAGFRSAVISPYEQIRLTEPRGFADRTVFQVLHMAGVSTPEGLAARREVNDWIRSTEVFDAVVDVARAVEDPDAPDHIHPDLDAGDGMHLNDAGARAMAEAVDPRTLVLEGR